MTFDEITAEAQSYVKDQSNAAKAVIQKGINDAISKLRRRMRRKYTSVSRTFTLTAGQSQYQLPENCMMVDRLSHIDGEDRTQLHRIDSGDEWERLKSNTGDTGTPEFYYIVSKDIIELHPTPDAATTGLLKYKARAKRLSATDASTGTISVANGSATVTGTGTSFAANMVGRYIKLDSSESDKTDYYQIIAVDSATELTIENFYDGATKTNASYVIGEVPDLPEEFHTACADYGVYRFYLWRKDKTLASEYQANFLQAYEEIGDEQDTVSSVIPSRKVREGNLPNYMRVPKAVE